ncbi:hypothetical protein CF319_g6442 [Tilletia indica]|nr:hypothetical protein CF319_g6442 [Tilletia indica]
MIDAILALTSNLAKQRRGRTRLQQFGFQFKKKRAGYGHLKILKKSWSSGILYPKFYDFGAFKSSERLPATLKADTHTSLISGNRYIWIPNLQLPRKPRGAAAKGQICSIDSGVRTSATIYDPEGRRLYKWGEEDKSRLARL